MIYDLLKPILFKLDPEFSHDLTLSLLKNFGFLIPNISIDKPKKVMGLEFTNSVGIAAGLDKNGIAISGLLKLGAGFIETGTATPLPQNGSTKPRLFRLTEEQAIINRMGLNNKGIEQLISNIKKYKVKNKNKKIVGVSITANNSSNTKEKYLQDIKFCMNKSYLSVDYLAIDISCPNVDHNHIFKLENLNKILHTIKNQQRYLYDIYEKYTPIAIKISPDTTQEGLKKTIDIINNHNIDGIIATNSSKNHKNSITGGISGSPLTQHSLNLLQIVKKYADKNIGIISVGGIMSENDAKSRIENGADLIQVYTGLIYKGPKILTKSAKIL